MSSDLTESMRHKQEQVTSIGLTSSLKEEGVVNYSPITFSVPEQLYNNTELTYGETVEVKNKNSFVYNMDEPITGIDIDTIAEICAMCRVYSDNRFNGIDYEVYEDGIGNMKLSFSKDMTDDMILKRVEDKLKNNQK